MHTSVVREEPPDLYNATLSFLSGHKSALAAPKVAYRVEAGLPAKAFDRLREALDVSAEDLSKLVSISRRTLQRRKTLKADESDRLFRFGMIFERALEVLGSRERARRWLYTERRALDGRRPIDLAATEVGSREVEDLLGRIEHGVFT